MNYKIMKIVITFTILLAVLITAPFEQAKAGEVKVLPSHSVIYITPMEGGLHEFLRSEIFKKKVPLSIALKEKDADYILTGTMVQKGSTGKWYHWLVGAAGRADSSQASVSLIKKGSRTLLWSSSVGDRSFWWGMLKRKGERKLAQRIVAKLKKTIIR
ncbi:MAG: hypothetical protein ABII18_12555 [bacterium]|nr:hypothetical protein [bacterium]MBU1918869.1 hypothetical protein [bacterium]